MSPAQTPCRRKFVTIRQSDPRPQRCAGGGIRGIINNVGCRENLFSHVRLTSALHVCDTQHRMLCAIVEPIKTNACTELCSVLVAE